MQRPIRNAGLAILLGCVALSSGCATQYRIPLSQETTKSVHSTGTVVMLRQQQILADYVPATGGAAGAIAGLPGVGLLLAAAAGAAEGAVLSTVNAGRAKDAEKQATPVREAVIDYDFRAQFQVALNRELSNVAWLKLGEIKYDSPDAKLEDLKQKAKQNNLLLLNVTYALAPGLRGFRLSCEVVAHPNDDRLKAIAAKQNPSLLYRNTFVYTHPLPVSYKDPDQAAQAWSANKGEAIRTALDDGIAEIARLIAMDMQLLDQAKPAGEEAKTVTYANVSGVVVSETEDRAVLRLANGSLRSLSKQGPRPLPAAAALAARSKPAGGPAGSAAAAPGLPASGTTWVYSHIERIFGRRQTEITVQVLRVDGQVLEESLSADSGTSVRRAVNAGGPTLMEYQISGNAVLIEPPPYLVAANGDKAPVDAIVKTGYPIGGQGIPRWIYTTQVQDWEQITVPAGTFRALRVEVAGRRESPPSGQSFVTGEFLITTWYAPEVKRFVRLEHKVKSGSFSTRGQVVGEDVVELLSYRPAR